MKQLFLAVCCVACATVANAQYTISGTLSGADGKKLYLFDDADNAPNDSVILKNGQFNFTVKETKELSVHALILEGMDYPMLFVPGATPQQLTTSLDKFPIATTLKGNENTQALQEYQKLFQPLIARAQALNTEASAIGADDEAGKEAFRKKAAGFSEDVVSTGRTFIQQHPKALASLWMLINELRPRLQPDEFERLFTSLDKSLQSSKYGQSVSQYIKSLKLSGIGVVAEDFAQNDVDGKPVKLSSFRGKYVLVDFWASWCGPCRQENPNVVKAFNKYKDKNFTILSVSLDEDKNRWVRAISQDGLAWTHVSDLQGWNNGVAVQYGIRSIPSNFLVDPQGRIVARNLRGGALDAKLNEILK